MNTEEGTTLVKMGTNVFIAIVILGIIAVIGVFANTIWNMFSREDSINRQNKLYAKYAAFDNKDVEGQELISLITNSEGMPMTLLFDGGASSPYAYFYTSYDYSWDASKSYVKENVNGATDTKLESITTFNPDGAAPGTKVYNYSTVPIPDVETLVELIQNAKPTNAEPAGTYGVWHTDVYYESPQSSVVRAIVATKINK